jgi:hypothetical protein
VGVESIRTEELPIAGELRKTQGGYEVVIDRGASQGAKRFTLAHEIGHAFFSSLDNRFPKRGVEVERICDLFAVELLFPESLFRIEYGGRPASVDSLFELADHFGASIMATAKRVSELYGAFVFQLDAGEVKWRSGKIRLPRETEPLIERLRMNGRARGEFVAKVGRWPSQWAFDGVQKGTSLFVLISPSANSSTTLVRTPALNRKQAGDTLSRFGK